MGKGGSKLKPDQVKGLREATGFSDAEINEWYQGFIKSYPKARLTKEDFKKVYASFFPSGDASQFAEHVFRTFDADKSGTIDFREFMCAMSISSHGSDEEKLKWAFKVYDVDGSGVITKAEMLNIVRAMYKTDPAKAKLFGGEFSPERCAEQIFAKMDKNNDQSICFFVRISVRLLGVPSRQHSVASPDQELTCQLLGQRLYHRHYLRHTF